MFRVPTSIDHLFTISSEFLCFYSDSWIDRLTHNIVFIEWALNVFWRSQWWRPMSIEWINETKEKLSRSMCYIVLNHLIIVILSWMFQAKLPSIGTITYFRCIFKADSSIDRSIFFYRSKSFQFIRVPWKIVQNHIFISVTHTNRFGRYLTNAWLMCVSCGESHVFK